MVRDGNGYINDINDASSSIYLVISKHSTQKMVSIDTSNNDATLWAFILPKGWRVCGPDLPWAEPTATPRRGSPNDIRG